VEPIASGGMAEVWRARAAGPAGVVKEVALKLVRGEHGARSDFARMFVAEARLAARLNHANVVQVYELVEEGDRHAIAMELVRGHDLARVVERCREAGLRLGLPRALQIGVEVARALDYAHRLEEDGRPLGVVHRDVSPHNVLLSMEGEVKLADFGIARAMGQAGLTDPGHVKGKLAYMAPEQARGAEVDPRTDVFALGVVLWELCAGRRLFARDSEAATLAAVLGGAPPSPPSAWNEAVPPALDALLLSALAADPGARPASAGAFGAGLSAIQHALVRAPGEADLGGFMRRLWPEPAPAPGRPEATAVRTAAATGPGGTATRTLAHRPGHSGRWAAGLLAALLLAGGSWIWLRPGVPAEPTTPAASAAAGAAPATADPEPMVLDPRIDPAAAARGEGRLSVSVHPWAVLQVDGRAVGETPQELALPSGAHRLRAVHPTFGAAEVEVVLQPGRHLSWRPALSREHATPAPAGDARRDALRGDGAGGVR